MTDDSQARIRDAFNADGTATVDTVASALKLPRDLVNEHAPWAKAELDGSNSKVYEVELIGPQTEWEFRDHPDYYDAQGRPRTGRRDDAPKVVRPAFCSVLLRARSRDEAEQAALATHPGYHTVRNVEVHK